MSSTQDTTTQNSTTKLIQEEQPSQNPSYKNFWKQLKVGQQFELIASNKIRNLYDGITSLTFNDNNKYDIQILPHDITFEIKYDALAMKTGNFFIEYYGYGSPSGLSVTEATFYVITDGKYYFKIETAKLKELVLACNIITTKDKLTKGFALNRFVLIENSVII
jgi:hypothetical protein